MCNRQLFERWCSDSRNGVIIAAYSVEGTLAKAILKGPAEIQGTRTLESLAWLISVYLRVRWAEEAAEMPGGRDLLRGARRFTSDEEIYR